MIEIEEAVQKAWDAVRVTSEDDPQREELIHIFDVLIREKNDKVLRGCREVVDATPRDHPDWFERVYSLIDALDSKHSDTKEMVYFDETIQLKRDLLKATSIDDLKSPMLSNWLASTLWIKYSKMSGAIAELDEAIQVARQSAYSNIQDLPDQDAYSDTLGLLLYSRFERIGAITDLDEAIQIEQHILKTLAKDDQSRAGYLINLSNYLRSRFTRTGTMKDIENSI